MMRFIGILKEEHMERFKVITAVHLILIEIIKFYYKEDIIQDMKMEIIV